MRNYFRLINNIIHALLNIFLSSHIIFLYFQYWFNYVVFFLFEYSNFVRTNDNYIIFQNETKRRRIEIKNAFNIFNNNNTNFFNNNSNSFHDFIIIYNRTLQNVIFIVNNRFSSKKNCRHRFVEFKNKRFLLSLNIWFYVMYIDVNTIETKLKKFIKRDKFLNSKIKVFTRFFFVNRVLNVMFFFVMQFSRRSKRIEKKTSCK